MTTLNTPTSIDDLLDYIEDTKELVNNLIARKQDALLVLTRQRLANLIAKIDDYLIPATLISSCNELSEAYSQSKSEAVTACIRLQA